MFGKDENAAVYIGSADMMTRNTEKRVEVACPVYDPNIKKRLLRDLKIMLADNVKAREMKSDGTYRKKNRVDRIICAQDEFMKYAITAKRPEKKEKHITPFEKLKNFFKIKRERK